MSRQSRCSSLSLLTRVPLAPVLTAAAGMVFVQLAHAAGQLRCRPAPAHDMFGCWQLPDDLLNLTDLTLLLYVPLSSQLYMAAA